MGRITGNTSGPASRLQSLSYKDSQASKLARLVQNLRQLSHSRQDRWNLLTLLKHPAIPYSYKSALLSSASTQLLFRLDNPILIFTSLLSLYTHPQWPSRLYTTKSTHGPLCHKTLRLCLHAHCQFTSSASGRQDRFHLARRTLMMFLAPSTPAFLNRTSQHSEAQTLDAL